MNSLLRLKNHHILTSAFVACFVMAVFVAIAAPRVGATSAAGFNAGRIIEDTVFTNTSSMNAQQIQDFLNFQNPNCDTQGTRPSEFGGGTRAQWGAAHGHPAPFVCLKDYSENSQTAAQIIFATAQQYQINPQVLIVLLQKEQGLVLDTWPLDTQYRTATGYGCPDTAPCDSQYYGLTNQLQWSGKMFRAILNNSPTWYTPYILGNNTIQWSPDGACGSSTVNIENRSTQALYNYTPYRPNQAALNAGYGAGDNCSAYGNRNFYLYFIDWFGSTSGRPFDAQYIQQSAYPNMKQNDTKQVFIEMRNVGTNFWKDQTTSFPGAPAIKVATAAPINRGSYFQDGSWVAYNRPTATLAAVYESDGTTLASDQHTVFPGQLGKYVFTLHSYDNTPQAVYSDWYQLVAEGDPGWDIRGGKFFLNVNVNNTMRAAAFHKESAFPVANPGTKKNLFFEFQNTGTLLWKDQTTSFPGAPAIKLATSGPVNRLSYFQDPTWLSASRPTGTLAAVYESDGTTLATDQHTVFPGQIGRYGFTANIPSYIATGTYREWFQLVAEGDPSWNMQGGAAFLDITVNSNPQAAFVSQSPYPTITAGQKKTVYFRYKNTGNVLFNSNSPAVHTSLTTTLSFATTTPINRASAFVDSTWTSASRPNTKFSNVYTDSGSTKSGDQMTAWPGQEFTYEFVLNVPLGTAPGIYREWFQPVREGAYPWDIGGTVFLDVTVN